VNVSSRSLKTVKYKKNSSADEIANVNFYAMRPESFPTDRQTDERGTGDSI